jgi:hypothetical protein
MSRRIRTGGLRFVPALLLFCACTPAPEHPKDISPLERSAQVMQRGDLDALLREWGKDEAFLDHSRQLADWLDPEGWLIAVGAAGRQHNLSLVSRALQSGDADLLREAAGFGDQVLRDDVLFAGHSLTQRRARDRAFLREGPSAAQVIRGIHLPPLPEGTLAYCLRIAAMRDTNTSGIHVGVDRRGLTFLSGTGVGKRSPPEAVQPAPPPDLPKGPWPDLSLLAESRWQEVQVQVLAEDGVIYEAELDRTVEGWIFRKGPARRSLQERLDQVRDSNLTAIATGLWRRKLATGNPVERIEQSGVPYARLIDPTDPKAERGWRAWDDPPLTGFRLLPAQGPQEPIAAALHTTPQGRRAATGQGQLLWLPE